MRTWSYRILALLVASPVGAASLPLAKPEDVGFSSARLEQVKQIIQCRIDSGELAGAVTLVARRGRIAHFEAHGATNLASGKPMRKDSLFNTASMSKPVTAAAVMMLVEEGKLRLTDPVSRYIPAFRGMKVAIGQSANGPELKFGTVPADREISVRDLLTHTSGLASGPMGKSVLGWRKPNETLAEYVSRLATTPLEFQPGARWAYSPAGFDTLSRLVESVSGVDFDEFLMQRIFDPLAMKDTFFFVPEEKKPRQATIYRYRDGHLAFWENATPAIAEVSGAGGLICTAGDYLAFAQMLLNGGQLNGKRLLSPRTVEMMTSPHTPDTLPGGRNGEAYGLGIRLVTNRVALVSPLSDGSFSHGGNFGTYFWVDPKEKLVAILMTQTSTRGLFDDFEKAVMQSLIERE